MKKINQKFLTLIPIIFSFSLVFACTTEISHTSTNDGSADQQTTPPSSTKKKPENQSGDREDVWNTPVTDAMIQKGKNIYVNTCAPCHGKQGKGNGPAAGGLNPKPRNYQKNEGQWMKKQTNKHLFKTIKHGGASVGLSPVMPSYKDQFSDRQIRSVVGYIKQLANGN